MATKPTTDRRQGPLSAITLTSTLAVYGPLAAAVVAGVTAWVTLTGTVGVLAGDAEERKSKIEANQKAIATIKLNAAVQAERDRQLNTALEDIKEAVKELIGAVKDKP